MTEKSAEVEDKLIRSVRNLVLQRRSLWTNFDKWVEEEPAVSRSQFEIVKSALLVYCEYPAIVYNKTSGEEEFNKKYSLQQQFIKFVNIANKTSFLCGDTALPAINVFAVISELFSSIPEFKEDTGIINDFLKSKLGLLLDPQIDWDKLFINVDIVRSVYWQLLFTLQLAPVTSEGQTEDTITYDDDRAKLMYGSFIVAILVSIGYEQDSAHIFKIPNFLEVDDVAEYIAMLISSNHFRTLSQFFLVGLWLVINYKKDGGMVTTFFDSTYSPEKREHDESKFQDGMSAIMSSRSMSCPSEEEVQREWETYVVSLLKNGFLACPDGSRIVQKGGRPRKEVQQFSSRIKKSDDPRALDDMEEPEPPLHLESFPIPKQNPQTGRFQKKVVEKMQKSPKKQRDLRKRQPISYQEIQPNPIPSTSSASAPPRSKVVHPTLSEVGLGKPVYMEQADLLKIFTEEVERRKREGLSKDDPERVKKLVYEYYDRIHSLSHLASETMPRSMKVEQAVVMQREKLKWQRGNSEETVFEEEPVEENEEEEYGEKEQFPALKAKKTKAGKKTNKKWKRQY